MKTTKEKHIQRTKNAGKKKTKSLPKSKGRPKKNGGTPRKKLGTTSKKKTRYARRKPSVLNGTVCSDGDFLAETKSAEIVKTEDA